MAAKPKVVKLPAVDPAMMRLSKLELIHHSTTGEAQAIAAGLELLRRATNRAAKASANGAGANGSR